MKDYIQYRTTANLMFQEELKFNISSQLVKEITIKTSSLKLTYDKEFSIIFELENCDDKSADEVIQETEAYLDMLLDELSFEYSSSFSAIEITSFILNDKQQKDRLHYDSVTFPRAIDNVTAQNLVDSIENGGYLINSYKRLFRTSLQMKDPISKFILLYSTLILKVGPAQSQVDAYISAQEPSVMFKASTRSGGGPDETIYTYLRNQIGHTQPSTNVNQISEEVKSILEKFEIIVKSAL
ncbi:hypothetical protein [Priestia aryabhattai]|uniref:hypothetical protein n=1 Tax=Priestia aryabhattai TaxID=412384 RepID=UPI003CEFC7DD